MNEELHKYLDLFTDFHNPVYYSIVIGIVLFLFLYINFYRFYLPSKKKYLLEKKELELRNQELEIKRNQLEFEHLRTFADLADSDPTAIIRVDKNGLIVYKNKCAKIMFHSVVNLHELLPEYSEQLVSIIHDSSKHENKLKWQRKYFSYFLTGINSLEIAQVTFYDLTSKIVQAKKIRVQKNKYKSLSLYLQNNLEKEKQRIGMELHDNICQNLYLIKLKIADSLKDQSGYEKNFNEIDSIMDSTLSELRDIMFDLRPKIIEDLGLFNAVQVLVDKVTKIKNITGNIDYLGEIKKFDVDTDIYLFRIIQESLNNIIKHSEATEFNIQFIYSEKYLMIVISDNGKGFDINIVDDSETNGLLNMSERVKALNGNMYITSSENGTLLKLTIPYML